MKLDSIRLFVTTPVSEDASLTRNGWFWLSLVCALGFSIPALREAVSAAYVIQDDTRQHVFWMQRFLDPELFPNDLIADYFQSVAPPGYALLYRGLALIGISPLLASKLLPPVLALGLTGFGFAVCLRLFPVPFAAFLSTFLLNQNLWMKDDLVSATPRAFFYPLFLAFWYFLTRRSVVGCTLTILVQGLFYPPTVLLSAGMLFLSLWKWRHGKISFSGDSFVWVGLVAAGLVLGMYAFQTSRFGPFVSLAQARTWPEFGPLGRTAFFLKSPTAFWLWGERSGCFPMEWKQVPFPPPHILAAVWLPILLVLQRWNSHFAALNKLSLDLGKFLLSSIGFFFLAHMVLFHLYLPSRFSQHSWRIATAFAAGSVLVSLMDTGLRWASRSPAARLKTGGIGLVIVCCLGSISLYPLWLNRKIEGFYPRTRYVTGQEPALYRFLAAQPKSIVVASLTEEANNLPIFAQRLILVGRESGIPYHTGYYNQFRTRTQALIQAHSTPDPVKLRDFILTYKVDYFLIDRKAFQPLAIDLNPWAQQFQPAANEARLSLQSGKQPALAQMADSCTVFESNQLRLVDARKLLNQFAHEE